MKKSFIAAMAAVGLTALLAGCATEMSKSEYAVDVTSATPGETFKVYNRKGDYIHQGKTPLIVVLPAQSDFFAREKYTIEYGTEKHQLDASYSPWYWGNVIMPFGFAVDGITGSMWALPKKIVLGQPQPDTEINL
ncbi:MAG: hypothetical protein PHQ27_10080 [Victivallales bacterium]|nr:hypothetical protein [Victivallales bacterium]